MTFGDGRPPATSSHDPHHTHNTVIVAHSAAGMLWHPDSTGWTWLSAALSGVLQHAMPFWLFSLVVRDLRASIASFIITLIPIFGISGAVIFLDERLHFVQWMGVALVGVSIFGVARYQQSHGGGEREEQGTVLTVVTPPAKVDD
jgi:drug/metabolite transporter (DMT)-like permease